jgi:hypothetical protein
MKKRKRQSREYYAVKGLFRWYLKANRRTARFEERVVLFLARSFEDAFRLAEKEAKAYCVPTETATFRIEPIGWWNAFQLNEDHIGSGTEVYSRTFDSTLSARAFKRRYYPASQDT